MRELSELYFSKVFDKKTKVVIWQVMGEKLNDGKVERSFQLAFA